MRLNVNYQEYLQPDMPAIVPGIALFNEDLNIPHQRGLARVQTVVDSIDYDIQIPTLYLTGGVQDRQGVTEACAMHNWLIDTVGMVTLSRCIGKIELEEQSKNTLENFLNIADLIIDERPEGVSIVTDKPHMRRTLAIVDKIVPKKTAVFPVAASYQPTAKDHVRELVALPVTKVSLLGNRRGDIEGLRIRADKYAQSKQKVRRAD